MADKSNRVCPACQGEKIIAGECVCDMEWRGTQKGEDWEDCQCTPDKECSLCSGTGRVDSEE